MFEFSWTFLVLFLVISDRGHAIQTQSKDSLESVISLYKSSRNVEEEFMLDQPLDDEWEKLLAGKNSQANLVADEEIDSDLANLLSYAESPDYSDEEQEEVEEDTTAKLEGPVYDEIFEVDVPESEEGETTTVKSENPVESAIDILNGTPGFIERPKKILLDDLLREDFNMSHVVGGTSENPQKHQSSLSFVFDSTGSMWDDLQQLKEGAEKIMFAMKEREDQPIYNYILVPFHDPHVGPVTVTRDHSIFLNKLDEIFVYGGGDCPEMSLGGIRKALEASLPRSYVYVLTDATAGDHFLVDDILNEIQRKEIQVVFILTGDCGNRTVPEYKVYEQIAEASSGQIFHLKKSDVNQVLDFVRTTLDSRRVGLYSISKIKASNTKPHNVNVDKSLKELMVTIAGDNPQVEFTSPSGEIVYEPPKVNEILTLDNIKVVNVVEPEAGQWAVSIKSDSDHDVRLTGLSELKFEHGFAVQPTSNIDETSHRPLQSSKNYLVVKPNNHLDIENITQVVLTGLDGQPMQELPMTKINDAYSSDAILIPPYFFNLLINGFDSQGNFFQRTTTTAIKPQPPEKPFIEMKSTLLHPMHKPLNISCHIRSLVPITQQWYKNDRPIGEANEKEQSGTFYWTDPYPTSHTSGIFKCQASNVAGITEASMDLQISEPPILKKIDRSILHLNHGNSVELPCYTLAGLPPPETNWLRNNVELNSGNGIEILYNRSLTIQSVTESHIGIYKCFASNLAGIDFYTIEIRINVEPKFKFSSEEKIKKIAGELLELSCETVGEPKPKVTWTKNGEIINKNIRGEILKITSVDKSDAGIYTCVATNLAGTAKKNYEIIVGIPPQILSIGNANVEVLEGELVSLACPIISDSQPETIWLWNFEKLSFDNKFLDDSNTLRFVANRNDNGVFECQAITAEGNASRKWDLSVNVNPIIWEPTTEIIRTTLNTSTNLTCKFDGFPPPNVEWSKNGTQILNNHPFRIDLNQSETVLSISKIQSEFAGFYVCQVENFLGSVQKIFHIIVDTPPSIRGEFPNSNISILYGGNLTISCQVDGSPKPYVLWTKNSKLIRQKNIFIATNNTITIQNATEDASGIYRCIAANSKGIAKRDFSVTILIPPQITNPDRSIFLEVQEGDSVQLECPHRRMFPPPTIIWKKNNETIVQESNLHSFDGNKLNIFAVQITDAGIYECIVSNLVGSTNYHSTLAVLYAPILVGEFDKYFSRKVGDEFYLECDPKGNPPPKVFWTRNGFKINDTNVLHIKHLQIEDSGEYICHAENFLNSIQSGFFLEILESPQILGEPFEVIEVQQNSDFSVKCIATGVPAPQIRWLIPKNLNSTKILNQKSLRFFNANMHHNGTYQCNATNSQGSSTKIIHVLIMHRPKIINEISGPIPVRQFERFQLVCEVFGFPTPTVLWYHNGKELTEKDLQSSFSAETSFTPSNTTQFSLAAENVTEEFRGEYQCWAVNKIGRESLKFQVLVLVGPKLVESDFEPYMEFLEGLPVMLDCTATGFPAPKIVWLKDNKSLDNNQDIEISADCFYMTIDKVQFHLSGFYQCRISNEIGEINRNFSINVLTPPRIPRDISNEKIRATKGDNLNLYCNYEGNPTPDIVWLKGLSTIQDFRLADNNRTLTLKNVSNWDAGSFSCLAINKAGASEKTYHLEVQEPPYFLSSEPLVVNKTIKLHRGFVLRCDIGGVPKPHVVWMKNNENIENQIDGKSLLIATDKSYLQVSNAALMDSGFYRCQAENSVGIIQRNFNISILNTGEWTSWSQWSSCSVSCGNGERFRSRSCDNGELNLDNNVINEVTCTGASVEKEACMMEPCPINGGWSDWQHWSPCSETCGPGVRTRMRYCNQPQPSYDGRPCSGPNSQQESCNERPCPENGNWSGWTEWGLCSKTCGKGVRARYRSCDNPRPTYGGLNCKGTSVEVTNCNVQPCPVDGGWTNWEPWSPCSATCGYGTKMRHRFCTNPTPIYGGKYCKGDNLMIDKCFIRSCKIKQKAAKLKVRGLLNDEDIPENVIYANISSEGVANLIESNSKSMMKNQKGWFPYLTFLVSPVSWQLAQDGANDEDEAEYHFTQKSKIAFATGQELYIEHVGQGMDQDGDLQVEIEMRGEVPIVQSDAQVSIQPYYENYLQTGDQEMMAQAHNKLYINGKPLKYSWNNSIEYDQSKNSDRIFIEKYSMQNIDTQYDENRNELKFSASSFVNRQKIENCPRGYVKDFNSNVCIDVNECEFSETNMCHSTQSCQNSHGSYTCTCQSGYKSIGIGSRCLDINECLMDTHQCSHECVNLPGTYQCKCPKGMVLSTDSHTCQKLAKLMKRFDNNFNGLDETYHPHSFEESFKTFPYRKSCSEGYIRGPKGCEDYNECEFEEEICSNNESCLNTKGSYFCIPTPCPYDYKRDTSTSSCVQFCNSHTLCSEGAAVAQSVSYTTLSISKKNITPHEPLLLLQIYSVDGKPLPQASFTLEDSTPGNSFMVINEENNGILSTFRIPEKDRVHRITIVGNSIDKKSHKLLYTTKFIIYLYVSD